ncbi:MULTISPECIES: IPExxxVDY family protein [unclassified Capnocytophaga]|jgi:hypothetical protein|uniref:IPExxxVDY family protein n=1 Tax=unclassified Capnocytophaga TaxID=2640652 RepID=UPI000202F149|nr:MULTISPECIES: IPExxxVDY family protein [unclassified Capnocytophaga]EGD33596.1 hypothetical protein HMPREF9071_1758 [Capnocytophaga sp. oral taxon 338 str. F0234]MEB3004429.1 IPExxxVDY family protein [Capnocytophaga sp. G2]
MGLVLEWDFDQYGEDECFMAIHSSLAPCKFVYWLNKELDICFSRAPEELNDKVSRSLFPLFIYQREEEQWYLIGNKVYQTVQMGLFSQMEQLQVLIRELPKVDYFLRIKSSDHQTDYLSLFKRARWIDFIYEILLFPEEKISQKEQKKLNEIKAKLIF